MSEVRRQEVREQTRAVLAKLSRPERQLLSRILKIEHEHVHLKRPRVKDEMLRAVRENIK